MSSPLISTQMRVYLRGMAAGNFTQVAVVERHQSADSVVGMSESWVTVATTNCWVRQMNNPDLKPDLGGLYTLAIFRILMPWGTDCRVGDQLLIGGDIYLVQNTNSEDANAVSLVIFGQKLENS